MSIDFKNLSQSIIPQIEDEEISLETKTILEVLFFMIVDGLPKSVQIKFERNKGSTFLNFFRDLILISLILEIITQAILILPLFFTPDDPSRDIFSIQILVITLFCSVSWTGFVYLTEDFRNLVRIKIFPIVKKNKYPSDAGFYSFIRQFFNGSYLKWRSGMGFRVHLRSIFYLLILIPASTYMFNFLVQSFFAIVQNPSATKILTFILFIFTFILMAFFALIIGYILLTIIAIFFYLFMTASSLEIEINPLIDMAGIQKFGDIILKSLYLVSFGLASIPALFVLTKVQSIPKLQFDQFTNQTVANISFTIRDNFLKSATEISINSMSQYYSIFFFFFFFVISSLIIILIFHYRIKQKKQVELQQIEILLQDVDFLQTEKKMLMERNQYLLSIHEKISTSYDWPIKKIFIIEILLAVIPLLVTHFL